MRRRSLALALSLLLPAGAFAQAQPQAAPVATTPAARSSATVVLTTAPADWRALDGQRVRIAAPLTLAGTDGLERFGQLTVAFDGRSDVPGRHDIFWPAGNPNATCDGRPSAATGIDEAGHRYQIECGGNGSHMVTVH